MRIRNILAVWVCLGLMTACSSVSVSTDYDKDQAFSSLKTYRWHPAESKVKSSDARIVNPIMDARIKGAIDKQLALQGFNKQSPQSDFIVNYSVTTQDKVDFDTYNTYSGFGPGWGWHGSYGHRGMNIGMSSTQTVAKTYQKGTLVIDIINSKNNKLIWRGLGSKKLPSTSSAEQMDELISLVVNSILAHFPPKQ